jgi:pimeloyl-ACP methyl ester carboxylesterase
MYDPTEQSIELDGPAGRIREHVQYFGGDSGLFGIVTEPASAPARTKQPAVILVNGGNNHRPGINRNYTEWARRWASRGFRVLRMDIRGLGDSPCLDPIDHNVLYRAETRTDLLEAVDCVTGLGSETAIVMGLCAGGYQSLQAALIEPRISGLVMLNPLRFHDEAFVNRMKRLMRDPYKLRRLFDVPLRHLPGTLRAEASAIASILRRRVPGTRVMTPVARSMLKLTRRGTDVMIVFSEADRMLPIFEDYLGEQRKDLDETGLLRTPLLEGADHIFSPLWSQEYVTGVLDKYLERHRVSRESDAKDQSHDSSRKRQLSTG